MYQIYENDFNKEQATLIAEEETLLKAKRRASRHYNNLQAKSTVMSMSVKQDRQYIASYDLDGWVTF